MRWNASPASRPASAPCWASCQAMRDAKRRGRPHPTPPPPSGTDAPWWSRAGCGGTAGRRPSRRRCRRRPRRGWAGRPPTAAGRSDGAGASPRSGRKCGIPCRHQRVECEEPGGPVVGMEAVTTPGVVAEQDVGSDGADDPGHGAAFLGSVDQLAVDLAEGVHPAGRRPRHLRRARRQPAGTPAVRSATSGSRSAYGSQLPFEPSVRTRWCTSTPRRRPLGQGRARPELDVVGVGADGQRHGWHGQVDGHGHGVEEVAGRQPRHEPGRGIGRRSSRRRILPRRTAHRHGSRPWAVTGTMSAGSSTSQARSGRSRTRAGIPRRSASARWRAKDPGP